MPAEATYRLGAPKLTVVIAMDTDWNSSRFARAIFATPLTQPPTHTQASAVRVWMETAP